MAEGGKVKHKEVIYAAHPKGMVKETDLRVEEREIELSATPGSGDVVVKTMYISLDPYLRGRMVEGSGGYGFPGFKLGEPLVGGVVGKVVMSANPEYKVGDLVIGNLKFCEYVVVPGGQGLKKLDTQVPPSYYLGVCGMPGITAWVGLKLIGKPKPGEQVYVTAASGAVGQIVGQLAKVYGCRVVGSAGTDDKVGLLKTVFGYDEAFNYKKEKDLGATLSKYFPDGIDIYFDNVGGEMLDAVLARVNKDARIALCGAISQYNLEDDKKYGLRNVVNMIGRCVQMEGFVIGKFMAEHMGSYLKEVSEYLKDGRVKYKEHVTEGIDNLPAAFVGIMKGENVGKAVIHVAE